MCFKFHKNRTRNEQFNFCGEGCPDFYNSTKPHTERWFQPTPKISAFYLDYKVFKNRGN